MPGQIVHGTVGTQLSQAEWESSACHVISGVAGVWVLTSGDIDNTAYAASWSGVNLVAPTKGAVYAQIQTLTGVSGVSPLSSQVAALASVSGISPLSSQVAALKAVSGSAGIISDTAFGSTWNGVTTIGPSKNTIFDLAELLGSFGAGDALVVASNAPQPLIDMATLAKAHGAWGDYIQICDGVSDEDQWNTAIIAVISGGGGKVIGTAGDFEVDGSILIPDIGGYTYLTLGGQGPATVIKGSGLADHYIKSTSESSRHMYTTIRDLYVNGTNQVDNGTSNSCGIKLFGASYSQVLNVVIMNCYHHGLWLHSDSTNDSVDYLIHGCKIAANGSGTQAGDGINMDDNATDVTVKASTIYGNKSNGVQLEGGGCIVIGNRMYSNGASNVYSNGMWTLVTGNNLAGDSVGVILMGNAHHSVVAGNIIQHATSGYGVRVVTSCYGSVIVGNTFDDNDNLDIYDEGVNTTIIGNGGDYRTENGGTVTLLSGQTSLVVSHGLGKAPSSVMVFPAENTSGKNYWLAGTSTTTFTIGASAAHDQATTLNYRAYT